MENQEILRERYALVIERVRDIAEEKLGREGLEAYFQSMAQFLLLLDDTWKFLRAGGLEDAPLEELQRRNHALYADVLPEHYEESFGNPAYAVKVLGEAYGQPLCWLHRRLRMLIEDVYEDREEDVTAGMELFVEVYGAFAHGMPEGELPGREEIRDILYWYSSDYAQRWAEQSIGAMTGAEESRRLKIVMESDLQDVRYLYAYGKYVSDNELETARYVAGLPEETVALMADTFTEGYRIGFEVTGKDLSKKATAEVYYHLGFERMIRRAVENFAKLNLRTAIRWDNVDGGAENRQYGYDHKDDMALFLDKNYVNRRLESWRAAYEKYREAAGGYAGPALVETFGETDFEPVNKPEAIRLGEEQRKLWGEFLNRNGDLTREYIKDEETSFTIIAFPVPEVGPVFRELFDETIRLNTLDYALYRDVQQKLIDVLDTADHCEVKGRGDNRTNLRVNLWKLKDASKETIFENCVADVNIPVGEVFTSPVLEGTEGTLHVTKVFLDGLEYRDLYLTFQGGMVTDYGCGNYESEEENRTFVRDNVLGRHQTVPLGEFAIGTNTTAYVMARRLGVEAKMPILIAEKAGPHFAVGDTCYAHEEDRKVYNPDGKEIVARENEKSRLREQKPDEAYFHCHTDITIPYDELGELTAVAGDGSRTVLIRDGRFVLPGTEVLNDPFGDDY